MKLLFDHNLSPRLVRILSAVYPGCTHVFHLRMDMAPDTEVWKFAAENGLMIVSKDADFFQRSLLLGAPPKVVWIRLGNCSVAETVTLLRERYDEIQRFHDDDEGAVLVLSPEP